MSDYPNPATLNHQHNHHSGRLTDTHFSVAQKFDVSGLSRSDVMNRDDLTRMNLSEMVPCKALSTLRWFREGSSSNGRSLVFTGCAMPR